MSQTRRLICVLAALAGAAAVLPAAASAQATRTWVSGVGDDVNPCSRTAPCKTFAGAISKTAAGGEIDALDPGGFGAVTITKAITLRGTGTLAHIVNAGTNGINVSAGVNDRVVIDEVDINGAGPTVGLNGINFLSGKSLTVRNSVIQASSGQGIKYVSSSPNSRLNVSGVSILGHGVGVGVRPTSAGGYATIRNSVISGNVTGVAVNGDVQAAKALIVDSQITDNGTGLLALAPLGVIRVSRSTVSINDVGLSTSTGGQLISSGNNEVYDNGTPGAFSSTAPLARR